MRNFSAHLAGVAIILVHMMPFLEAFHQSSFSACLSVESREDRSALSALTERQMQFWEDVEEGLDDIQDFYAKQGQDIDRIRTFGKRYVFFHEF